MEKGKQTILQGALILTASTMVVKVIGALFKIPLANILGGVRRPRRGASTKYRS